MGILKPIFLAIILQNLIFIHSYEYCRKENKLCGNKTIRHIVCNKEQIEPLGVFVKLYPMTDVFMDWILYWHNHYRNEVACGRVEGSGGTLPSASQMRELSWDYELEYLAGVHASRCNIKHDQCRNSERIPESGQNLAYEKTSADGNTPMKRAFESINMWFNESIDVPAATIDKYEEIPDVKIGHFTVLVNDQIGRIGCAIAACKAFPNDTRSWHFNFVTCNYDYTNIIQRPVYITGDPATNCKIYGSFGKSKNFTCLCGRTYNKRNSSIFFWL